MATQTRVLDAILAAKREEIATLKRTRSRSSSSARATFDTVRGALERRPGDRLRLIAEIKRKSPSAGELSSVLSIGARAIAYAESGAAMISVLCDERFFGGSFEHLREARSALGDRKTPLLAKEFILDEVQLEEAAAAGADAALLIVRIVDADRLHTLVRATRALGLEPLVEVVTEDELAAALAADARVIGVNARDLDTLVMDPSRAARVLAAIPSDRIALHLSGLKTPDDVAKVAKTSAHGALIGESLMRLDDPSSLLREMVAAG